MNKKKLIQKWLDHALNAEELEAFKKLEDYDALRMLDHNLQNFEAPDFDENQVLQEILPQLKVEKPTKKWLKPLLRIAAILVISIGSFWFLNQNTDINISTLAAQKTTIDLPDNSKVIINANSNITYNKKTWKKNRVISLQGEAFFKVAHGSRFDVKTSNGIVTVLGTQFNVQQRDDYFEVICYEGSVGVLYNKKESKLKPGDHLIILDDFWILESQETAQHPSWINNESQFKSLPYKYVLAEFERQYNVTFITEDIDLNQLFTGNFIHDNYPVAIKSVTLPLHVTYSKNNNTITLKSE